MKIKKYATVRLSEDEIKFLDRMMPDCVAAGDSRRVQSRQSIAIDQKLEAAMVRIAGRRTIKCACKRRRLAYSGLTKNGNPIGAQLRHELDALNPLIPEVRFRGASPVILHTDYRCTRYNADSAGTATTIAVKA